MMPNAHDTVQTVVKLAQELLQSERGHSEITPDLIDTKIDLVLSLNPRWAADIDRIAVKDELIRRFSIWIGQDTRLINNEGHVKWLVAERKKDWRYWQRYREWLERSLPYSAVDALDKTTDSILALLEDPLREGLWDRRGLVVGHVQSGKTGNYTGLICKAADAGYKIIIVLAGLHNNLRSQTQIRLDEGFLGYETTGTPENDYRPVGVGTIDSDISIRPNHVTNRSDRGDFVTAAARNLGITPEQRPWLFVVKKNKTVLERLNGWIRNHVADQDEPERGRRIVSKLPLLVIDDEADHASVDTGGQEFDANGMPDEEHEPTAINQRIRRLLSSFGRAAYVGYTATPFANIFIHNRGTTRDEGPDLFPSSFIINLAAPSNYIGPTQVFGQPATNGRINALPLVRTIRDQGSERDQSAWIPSKHKNGHLPRYEGADRLPPSLVEAIDQFILGCAVRKLRGQATQHCSMLVHVTRFTSVQDEVRRQIQTHITQITQRLTRHIDDDAILMRLRGLWESDFVPTTSAVHAVIIDSVDTLPPWNAVESQLADVLSDIVVRGINGTAKDALDYLDHAAKGLKVIAVGGDKLARGLTLDGLTVSYFLRASRMYDTLMQMGRWFGYRPGYLDLCRLYTTSDLIDWFGHIADAAEELRDEFDLMANSGATPKEYGLRVQSHPLLLVTSTLKMRAAQDLWLSFSGDVLETIAFYTDPEILGRNLTSLQVLLQTAGRPEEGPEIVRERSSKNQKWNAYLWRNLNSTEIIQFLMAYRTHPAARKVKSELLVEFIQEMNKIDQLTLWNVAVMSGGGGEEYTINRSAKVKMQKRENTTKENAEKYSIGRLLSPPDEGIDLTNDEWEAALKETRRAWSSKRGEPVGTDGSPEVPGGGQIRTIRGKGLDGSVEASNCPLLLIYMLDPGNAGLPPEIPVVAFGISFPVSDVSRKVKYTVNAVQLEQWKNEYGAPD